MVSGQSCRKDAAVLTVQFYLPLFLHLSKYLGSVSDNGEKKKELRKTFHTAASYNHLIGFLLKQHNFNQYVFSSFFYSEQTFLPSLSLDFYNL